MYRRKRVRSEHHAAVSLFSFIDVLGGVIGALSLIIVGVSLSQIVPEPSSANPLASQMNVLENEIRQKNDTIERLREVLTTEKEQHNGQRNTQQELAALLNSMNHQIDRESRIAQMLAEKHDLQTRIAKLQQSRGRLRKEVSQLDQAIREQNGTVQRDRIEVHFAGRGLNLKPTFVECTSDGLVIRQETQRTQIHWRSIGESDEFRRIVDRVKATPQGSVIFLIRPDGIHSFNLASAEVDKRQVRCGKLPIPGHGDLDLGRYEKGTGEDPRPERAS